MTSIRVDPNELTATATVLRSAAVELAEIGSQLPACACCPMPPATQEVVNAFVNAVDNLFDQIAGNISALANDLSNRATLAYTDMTSASAVGGTGALTGAYSSTMTLGGGSSGITIVDPSSGQRIDPSTLYTGVATIGGFAPLASTPSPSAVTIGGFSSVSSGMNSNPAMILAQAADRHRQRANAIGNRILSNPRSTAADIQAVFNAQNSMNASITRTLAPSRSDMEQKVGHILTMGEYYNLVPEARPPRGSLI